MNLLCFKVQILFSPNVFVERMLASLKSRIREGMYVMVQDCGFIYD